MSTMDRAMPGVNPSDRVRASNGLTRPKRWTALIALVAIASGVSAVGVIGVSSPVSAVPPLAPVDLGLASTFAVLTIAAVGNTASGPVTTLRGDLGAGGAVTGFPPGVYTGALYSGTAVNPALVDLAHAYSDAQGRPGGAALAPDLIGVTVTPGVYNSAVAVANTGTFTIDAQNNANAVFIFQIGAAFSASASSHMVLINGAKASNVFWQVNGAATVGATSSFVGTIMAMDAIGIGAGTVVNGRALSRTGAVAVNSNEFYSSPPAVTITGGATALTTDTTPTITGTTSVRSPSTVSVTIHGELLTPTPLSDGTWSATPVAPLANGPYTVTASVTDGAANIGTASQSLTVDTVLPIVTIAGGTPLPTNDPTPTISGTTDIAPGQVVSLSIVRTSPATTINATAVVQADSSWNSTPNGFSAGTWTVTATVTDPAGNTNTDTQSLVIDTVGPVATITGGASALTNNARPLITGTATGATLVEVTVDGQNLPGLVQDGNDWSVQFPVSLPALSNGTHHVSMTATDGASNIATDSQTLTVDTILPAITIDPGTTDVSNDPTPTISGTTDVAAGVTVSVMIGTEGPRTAVVQGDGTWNTTATTPLLAGDVTVTATVSDPAGNIGSASQTLTIDLTAPVVTITGGASNSNADATPAISGAATGVGVGSSVSVTFAGQTLTSTTGVNGAWSVTAATVANASYPVNAYVVDAAGNTGSASQSLTINAVVPVVAISGGLTMSTSDSTPTVAGSTSALAGSLATVTIAGQTLIAIVQPGGSWNVTAATLANGMVAVNASVLDINGNTGSATQDLTIASVVSAAPTIIEIIGGASRSTNDATPMIAGTTDANDGREITVTVGTQTMTASSSAGTWSVVAAHLADGTYVVNATASAIGGTPGAASQSLTIDTVPPVVAPGGGSIVVTNDSTPPITGTGATPGSTVTVTVGGQTLTTTAGADGTWSVTPTALPPGTYDVVISITDPAGNLGIGTQAITVLGTATPIPTPTEFMSVGPKRVFDTRAGQSPNAIRSVAKQQVGGAYELQVQLTDLAGFVPADGVGAVSLNVTSTGASVAGFITVYACGTRELVSSVNFPALRTVANAVVAPVSANGMVCFYANTPTDIVVDVNGWFATGRVFTAVGPKRVFDTRPGQSPDALRSIVKTQIPAGGQIEVRLTDLPGFVPADGVGSVSLNVVVANPAAAGFITVNSCGERALVSSVNFVAGQTVANAVFAPVSATGTVCFFSSAATDLVVDINGWLKTGSGFSAVGPARVLDTRAGQSPDALRFVTKAKIGGGNVLEVKVTDLVGFVPATGVNAVSLNVTATNPDADGFITVYSCGTMEEVSSLNYSAGATVANAVLAPVSANGTICLYSNAPTDVVVDINGWIANAAA